MEMSAIFIDKQPQKLYEPNELTYQAIENAENDVDMYGPFDTISEMMEALNA